MNLLLQSGPSGRKSTTGEIFIDGLYQCFTLEDVVREIPGRPVAAWKVFGQTAIPAGHYRVTLEDSPRFGMDTLTVNNVPGFAGVRIHGGNNADDTEGCILVGDVLDWDGEMISGARSHNVLVNLKAKVKAAIDAKDDVWIDVVRA